MAGDDSTLRLDIDTGPAKKAVKEFEEHFKASVTELGAAVQGGLDPLSDEAQALADSALDAGRKLANAGTEGAAAFKQLTGATREEINALADVSTAAKQTAPELEKVAEAAAEAAQGVRDTGTSAETAVPRINSLGGAIKYVTEQANLSAFVLKGVLVVGLLQVAATINGELVGALNSASEALGGQGDEFKLVAGVLPIYTQGIEDAAGVLGELVDAVDTSAGALRLERAEIDAHIAARERLINTMERQRKKAAEAAAQANRAAAERGFLEDEVETGKAAAAAINAEIEAEARLREAIAGSNAELQTRVERLAGVVAGLTEHGAASKAVRENIAAEVAELVKAHEQYGIALPAALKALRTAYPELAKEQAAAAAAARDVAAAHREIAVAVTEATGTQQRAREELGLYIAERGKLSDEQTVRADPNATTKLDTQRKSAEELRQEIDALNASMSGIVPGSAEAGAAVERLHELQTELGRATSVVEIKLRDVGQAASAATPGLVDLAEATEKARKESEFVGPVFSMVGDSATRAGDGLAELAAQFPKVGRASEAVQQTLGKQGDAIAGLAQRQTAFNADVSLGAAAMGQLGDAATGTAEAVGQTTEQLAAMKEANPAAYMKAWATEAEKVEQVLIRVKAAASSVGAEILVWNSKTHLQETLRLAQELSDVLEEAS